MQSKAEIAAEKARIVREMEDKRTRASKAILEQRSKLATIREDEARRDLEHVKSAEESLKTGTALDRQRVETELALRRLEAAQAIKSSRKAIHDTISKESELTREEAGGRRVVPGGNVESTEGSRWTRSASDR